jgi:hypothetical protein
MPHPNAGSVPRESLFRFFESVRLLDRRTLGPSARPDMKILAIDLGKFKSTACIFESAIVSRRV